MFDHHWYPIPLWASWLDPAKNRGCWSLPGENQELPAPPGGSPIRCSGGDATCNERKIPGIFVWVHYGSLSKMRRIKICHNSNTIDIIIKNIKRKQ